MPDPPHLAPEDDPKTSDPPVRTTRQESFPIVGLGSSAGGLQALRTFLSRLPADSGMAFVVVSHHHADHENLLPGLLQHVTSMPVEEVTGDTPVAPGHVYVPPPGRQITLDRGALRIDTPRAPQLPALPIDAFLRSLASDVEERAVAIVLSGTGSDGTLGVQAVKAAGGLVLVQSEASAEFSGMPSSAIATGLADFIGTPEEMPERLLTWSRSPYLREARGADGVESAQEDFRGVLARLRTRTGHDFSGYKPGTVLRRIERRRNLHQLERLSDYVQFLEEHDDEVSELFQDLLIGVTSFFRDPDAFDALESALMDLLASKHDDTVVRAWVAGCSTGEEAYSCAIMLRECLERLGKPAVVQVFATDLDARAIETARHGRYPAGIAADVTKERLARYFLEEGGFYQVRKEIREMLVFATQDLLADPPFTHVDLVSCRNLMIYLSADLQRRVLALLHYALEPDGLLLLGSSEATTVAEELFIPLDRRWKLYRRRETASERLPAALPMYRPAALLPRIPLARPSAPEDASPLLARLFAPPAVLVNDRGEVVHVHGRTGSFLEPAQGRASPMNLLQMAREGLRPALTWLLREAAQHPERSAVREVRVASNGGYLDARVVARRVPPPDPFRGLILISFQEFVAGETGPDARREPDVATGAIPPASANHELEQARIDLQTTVEELQSTNEELSSSNEEVQATNEELQSANEELETSREELQSLNEELQTVNGELRAKVDELAQASDDVENLLDSTSVATLFLDRKLCIKRFTSDIDSIVRIQATDVGRPIADLRMRVDAPNLADEAGQVLRTLTPTESEIRSEDGRSVYLMRIQAYRTRDNVVDGVVLTFVDVTRQRQLEASNLARQHAQAIVETVRQPLLTLGDDLRVHSANRAFCRMFHTTPAAVEGCGIFELPSVRFDGERLRELLNDIIPHDTLVRDFELGFELPDVGGGTLRVDARRMLIAGEQPTLILLALSEEPEGAGDD